MLSTALHVYALGTIQPVLVREMTTRNDNLHIVNLIRTELKKKPKKRKKKDNNS